MTLKYLIQKEFLQIRRNAFLPRLIVVFPIMVMCVLPWIMNQEVKNIVVDVVDNDRSAMSQRLVHDIEASKYFIFNGQKSTYEQALQEVQQSQADIILVIPRHYGRDLAVGQMPQVLIAANAVDAPREPWVRPICPKLLQPMPILTRRPYKPSYRRSTSTTSIRTISSL